MRICVLVASAEDGSQAGVRIRYRGIEAALKTEGHALQVTPIQEALESKAAAADVYVISKCYDARAFLAAKVLRQADKLVGVDLFDDYFSQAHDSRLSSLRYWLNALSGCVDFLLCSTPAMRALALAMAPQGAVHLMNDPASRLDAQRIRRALRFKLEEVRRTGVLHVAWFGIGDNPYFPVGLKDLVGFGADLNRLQRPGLAVRLGILTNRRALAADTGLGRLAVPYTLQEWTGPREARLLARSLLCFLPVNAQNFSVAKSLNRAVSALAAGTQVLSRGYPLYDALAPFIYRAPENLLDDLGRERLALREETVPDLMRLLEQHADSAVEARGLLEFFEEVLERNRSSAPAAQQPIAVVHGSRTTDAAHKLAQRVGALSVCSPYCKSGLNFDLRFALSEDVGLEVLIAEKLCERLAPPVRARLKRHGRIISTVYKRLEASDPPAPGATALARMETPMSVAAGHAHTMAGIERVLGELFPGIRCYFSEHAEFPLAGCGLSMQRYAFFVVNLLQDVNIVRPLVFIASRDLGLRTVFLVSRGFAKLDTTSLWMAELEEIGAATATPVLLFEHEGEALQLLQDKAGVLVAASESDRIEHVLVHRVLRAAPAGFVKITLQHGFECLGFLHNRAHDLQNPNVTFAADILCGWSDASRLASMAPSQRSKLYVSGPAAVLQTRPAREGPRSDAGLVCENLHSVRLKASATSQSAFMDTFSSFCGTLHAEGRAVVLRPHPGGQYALKQGVPLAPNVRINNHPIYKVDLGRFAYGISAPSSVLLDMVLAGIPAAVWCDPERAVDIGNYEGLTEIGTAAEWVEFSREAVAHPDRFIERQKAFLEKQRMPTDPQDVHRRFATLLAAAMREPVAAGTDAPQRVLIVTTSRDATLQLYFLKPLAALVERGEMSIDVLTELQIDQQFGEHAREPIAHAWLDKHFALAKPTVLVFCRYSGPHADYLAERARREGIPVVYHIDDDLLNVPLSVGARKQRRHSNPQRLATVRYLLDNADLVYCSTPRLRERFENAGAKAPLVAGAISCAGEVLVPAVERPVRRVGYMGIDKSSDLELVLPALVSFLRRHPEVEFHLFGSFTRLTALEEFAERVVLFPSIRDYEEFLGRLAQLKWDIGICPLAPTPFNLCKANNKWIEYTSVGAAVIASGGAVYDQSCADGCGLLAESPDEWLAALERLVSNPAERTAQVQRAQAKLSAEYSADRLRHQVLGVFAQARPGPA